MTITEAIEFFKNNLNSATNKRDIRTYEHFITTLSGLKNKDYSEENLSAIEEYLDNLELKTPEENHRKYFHKKHNKFLSFLKEKFSLVPEGHFTALGMSLGMCFGLALGTAFGSTGTSIGLLFGMIIGLLFGQSKDKEAEKNDRVLKKDLKE